MSEFSTMSNNTASLPFARPPGWEGQGVLRATSAIHRATLRVLAKTYPQPAETALAMESLAAEFPGSSGNRMRQFVWFLNSGVPIVEAIQRTPDLLQPAHGLALRLAEQAGTFQEMCWTLLQRDANLDSLDDLQQGQSVSQRARLLGGFLVLWLILTFFAIFIIPTFQLMFDEFGLELPGTFPLLISVMHLISLVMPIVLMLVLVYLAVRIPILLESLSNRWSPNRGGRRELPTALAVRALLANAAESDRPVGTSLADLSTGYSRPTVRQKLRWAFERSQQGQDPWAAVTEQGLLSRHEVTALRTAQSRQTQAWLLRWFVAQNLSRRSWWSSLTWRVTSFLSMALLACIVALAVISVFSVLISLIEGLA